MYFGGGLVPYYMVLKGIHMLNTFWVFIFPMMMSVYNMILIRSYIESMPDLSLRRLRSMEPMIWSYL